MATVKPDMTACRDGCGRSVPDAELLQAGWTFLPISRRWRCPVCWRALEKVSAPADTAPVNEGA